MLARFSDELLAARRVAGAEAHVRRRAVGFLDHVTQEPQVRIAAAGDVRAERLLEHDRHAVHHCDQRPDVPQRGYDQQRLDDNCTLPGNDRRGAVREGYALLQGLVLCGQCGRRMSVRYTRNGTTPSYECNQAHKQQGGRTCQFVRGDGVDAAVARLFLEAIQPAQWQRVRQRWTTRP
jgi:hypothetical protein